MIHICQKSNLKNKVTVFNMKQTHSNLQVQPYWQQWYREWGYWRITPKTAHHWLPHDQKHCSSSPISQHHFSAIKMQLFFERIENVLHYSMITQNPYCSSVLNSCLKEDGDRLERLQVRVLRNLFNDFYIGYDSLCSKTGYSLSSRRKQDMWPLTRKRSER